MALGGRDEERVPGSPKHLQNPQVAVERVVTFMGAADLSPPDLCFNLKAGHAPQRRQQPWQGSPHQAACGHTGYSVTSGSKEAMPRHKGGTR